MISIDYTITNNHEIARHCSQAYTQAINELTYGKSEPHTKIKYGKFNTFNTNNIIPVAKDILYIGIALLM